MTLVRYNPNREFDMVRRTLNHMMNQWTEGEHDEDVVEKVWRPRVDIFETEAGYQVEADLPGMTTEDLSIDLEDGLLTISGERKAPEGQKEDCCHVNERVHGKFRRTFRLHNSIDTEKIDAGMKHGVLVINLPKMEQAKPRKIKIKAN